MSIDALERKVASLLRVVNAQEHGSNGVFISTDARGKTPEGADKILGELLAQNGLKQGDLEEAGIPVRFANLHFLAGRRRIGITTKEQADAFLAGTWRPCGNDEHPVPTSLPEIKTPSLCEDAVTAKSGSLVFSDTTRKTNDQSEGLWASDNPESLARKGFGNGEG